MSTFAKISSVVLFTLAAHAQAERVDFVRDTTITTPKGVVTQHTEQEVTANGFTRETVRTNPKGQTATREVEVVRDPATQTVTHSVSGTHFNGKTYDREKVTQKTDDGYTRSSTMTTPNGKTRSKTVDVSRVGNTTTRDLVKINNRGTVKHSSTVKVRRPH